MTGETTVVDVKLSNIEEKIDTILERTDKLGSRMSKMENQAAMMKGAIIVFGILWTVIIAFLGVVFERLF